MTRGRDHLTSAYHATESTDFDTAKQQFMLARSDLIHAESLLKKPVFTVLMVVPGINNNVSALRKVTASGVQVAWTGEALTRASAKLMQKGRLPSFGLKNGRVNTDVFVSAKPDIDEAAAHARAAFAEYREIPQSPLFSSIKHARDELAQQLPRLLDVTRNMQGAFDVVPRMLGEQGKRRYFLAIQNNAELRATGGIIGNYGIITADHGQIKLNDFNEIHRLQKYDQLPIKVPADYMQRYGRFKAASTWLNINMSPDFPTVGRVVLGLYKSAKGEQLDGVISIDPIGLKYLLTVIGPVTVPDTEHKSLVIDDKNVVSETLIKPYAHYKNRQDRKNFLSDIAKAVWARTLSGDVPNKQQLMVAVNRAFAEKHMVFFSTHREEQKLLQEVGYAGALMPVSGDYLQVVMQNHGANKLDVYVDETIDYFIDLRADGSARARAKIVISNTAPAGSLTDYVSGDGSIVPRGYTNTWLNVYTPKSAQLIFAKEEGKSCATEVGQETDKCVFSHYVRVPPGGSKTVEFIYELPSVLAVRNGEFNYIFDCQAQPVVNAPRLTLIVRPPKGFEFSRLPAGFKKNGEVVTWGEDLVRDTRLDFLLGDKR
ncbi:DUF4012 domain-containing protein [Candidatus Aquicultor secundus]|uniref:DUF4012 domain-containing protein n=1 Tax=Candidatus Aquicultor secundus TaxID=1973895 RepID=UPI00257E6C90|nr:DUF4012 domain-containing protein [Candidatus Aquicultor secundus]